jgi:hypothetical protein
MHMKIGTIVYAISRRTAHDEARRVLERLTKNGEPFDCFTTVRLTDDGTYEEGVTAIPDDDPVFKTLIDKFWSYTVDDFKRNLEAVKKILRRKDATLENLMEEKPKAFDFFRHRAYSLGKYSGSTIWLYDNDGEGIQKKSHLDNALNKWKCLYEDEGKPNPYRTLSIYLVLADVHY